MIIYIFSRSKVAIQELYNHYKQFEHILQWKDADFFPFFIFTKNGHSASNTLNIDKRIYFIDHLFLATLVGSLSV